MHRRVFLAIAAAAPAMAACPPGPTNPPIAADRGALQRFVSQPNTAESRKAIMQAIIDDAYAIGERYRGAQGEVRIQLPPSSQTITFRLRVTSEGIEIG